MPSAHRSHRVLWVAALGLLTILFHGCQPSGAELYEDGKRLVAAGRYNDAIAKLTEAAQTGGGLAENPALLNLVGYAYHQIGELEAAEVAYKNAARFEEQKEMRIPELRVNWARLYLDQSEPEPAIALLDEASKYQPESVEIALLLAEGYRKRLVRAENSSEITTLKNDAIHTLRSALDYKPNPEKDRIYHAMSLVYLAAGDLRQALDNAQRALQENTNNDEARWSFAMLSQALLPTVSEGARDQATRQAIERFEDYIEKGDREDRVAEAKTIVDQLRSPVESVDDSPVVGGPTDDGPLVAEGSNGEAEGIEIDVPEEDEPSDETSVSETDEANASDETPTEESDVGIADANGEGDGVDADAPNSEEDPSEFAQEFANEEGQGIEEPATEVADSTIDPDANVDDANDTLPEDPIDDEPASSEVASSSTEPESATEELFPEEPTEVSGGADLAAQEPAETVTPPLPREDSNPASPSWATPDTTTPPPLTPEAKRRAAYAAFRAGAMAQKQGAYARAIEEYNNALAYDAEFYECLFNKGYCAYQQKDYQAAAQSYAAALRLQPQATNTRRNYIVSLLRLNSVQEALRQTKTWLRQDPNNAEAHLIAAKVYVDKFQNTASARHHYESYLALNPTSPDAPEIRAWLNRSYASNSQQNR